ncbi:MAG: hypothetical protein WC294_09850, partial [Methanoregula sp.]
MELEIYPSFSAPLKITAKKDIIAYQGNLKQENFFFGPNVSGKIARYRWGEECLQEWEKLGKLPEKLMDYVKRNVVLL